MDNFDVNKLRQQRKEEAKTRNEQFEKDSKDRLRKIINTKITTVFIGSLDAIEKRLGYLWGYGSNEPLTKEQQELRDIFAELRVDILNLGNNQKRALNQELDNNTIIWERFQYQIPIIKVD